MILVLFDGSNFYVPVLVILSESVERGETTDGIFLYPLK
jgi:hypothetical protein